MKLRKIAFCLVSTLAVAACGGSTPEAEAPDAEESSEKAEKGDTGDEASGADSEEATEAEPPAPSGPDPRDVLLKDEAVFVINFTESDVGKAAEEKCEKQSKGDPAKRAKCMSAVMKRVTREGFAFQEDESGDLYYIWFSIQKNKRLIHNKVKCELGEPKGNKITITTSGPDKAPRRKGKAPATIELEVQDEYTIISEDPSKGRVVYETRLGLFDEGS